MRQFLLPIIFVTLSACAANAQVQEKKLIDRLLQPDMSLQNDAQNKQFSTTDAQTTKHARTKSFAAAERPREKKFDFGRAFFGRLFRTRQTRDGERQANLNPRTQLTTAQISAAPSSYGAARSAHGSEKSYDVSEFNQTRPFLVRGKSQKALSQQDRPLTIDEVRELLNKNK